MVWVLTFASFVVIIFYIFIFFNQCLCLASVSSRLDQMKTVKGDIFSAFLKDLEILGSK